MHTISEAISSIPNPSADAAYTISVGPGSYVEHTIAIPSAVHIIGAATTGSSYFTRSDHVHYSGIGESTYDFLRQSMAQDSISRRILVDYPVRKYTNKYKRRVKDIYPLTLDKDTFFFRKAKYGDQLYVRDGDSIRSTQAYDINIWCIRNGVSGNYFAKDVRIKYPEAPTT